MAKTKITFSLVTKNKVYIHLNGKTVGQIFSQNGDDRSGKPYPHVDSEYCNTSLQLCGFDSCSEIWSCGVYHGKKDLVVNFVDKETEFMKSEEEQYRRYVKNFIDQKIPMDKLKDFQSWVRHMHHPNLYNLRQDKE